MVAVGMTFGSWAVLSVDNTGRRAACRCVCGTVRIVSVEALNGGVSSSCGCQQLSPRQSAVLREEAARLRRQRDWRPGERSR
jgi:hypothetical protein